MRTARSARPMLEGLESRRLLSVTPTVVAAVDPHDPPPPDMLGRFLRKESLTASGWWTLLFASVATPFTALAGWMWLRWMEGMDAPSINMHKWLGTALAILLLGLVSWRGLLYRRSETPGWAYFVCAVLFVGALIYQGDLGGSMSFASAGEDMPGRNHGSNTTSTRPDTQPMSHSPTALREGWQDHIDVP